MTYTVDQIAKIRKAYIEGGYSRDELAERSVEILGFEVPLGTLTDWVHQKGWGRERRKYERAQRIAALDDIGDEIGVLKEAIYGTIVDGVQVENADDLISPRDLATLSQSYTKIHEIDSGRQRTNTSEFITRDECVLLARSVAEEFFGSSDEATG